MENRFSKYAQQGVQTKPADPMIPGKVVGQQLNNTGQSLSNVKATVDARVNSATQNAQIREANANADIAEGNRGNTKIDNTMKLRAAYESAPAVKEYRVGISSLGAALNRAADATGDTALIYDYAKAMDPGSVVREAEMGMAAGGASVIDQAAASFKKQFGIIGGGQLAPQLRSRLKREIATKVAAQNKQYSAQRARYAKDAERFGVDPRAVTGDHDGDAYMPQIKEYEASQRKGADEIDNLIRAGKSYDEANVSGLDRAEYEAGLAFQKNNPGFKGSYRSPDLGYDASIAGQGMSGVNEGLASVAGAPVDLMTGALNLGSRGINALANTDIPQIDNPTLGSDWFKQKMGGWAITAPTNDMPGQVARRVGESVGAAAVPAGFAGTLGRAAGQLVAGAGGGIGAATAQQAFPGNPLAEMAGEVIGGGGSALGLAGLSRRGAQRGIEAAIPTSDDLREQAGQLYRQAESRGVVADPQDTATLANNLRRTLTDEGHISPGGTISDVYPKARQAMRVADEYAGGQMNPTQIQTLRKLAGDGLSSPEATERRLGRLLTEGVDDWAAPLAPELADARGVARRYLEAGDLETARELAGAQASQFSGSGFENALRTQYRALDRGQIKGQNHFSAPVSDAIETVSRGTPGSNFARGLGKYAPTGVVSSTLGGGAAGALAGSMLGGPVGAAVGGTVAGAGTLGRHVATRMGTRAADVAELTARNGGALDVAPLITPETLRDMQMLLAAESAKYSQPERQKRKGLSGLSPKR